MSSGTHFSAIQSEQQAFDERLDAMLTDHKGEFVVFHDGEPVGYFPTLEAAYEAALERFGLDEPFLLSRVERIPPTPVSYAWDAGVMFG